jgi:hypothetical protein
MFPDQEFSGSGHVDGAEHTLRQGLKPREPWNDLLAGAVSGPAGREKLDPKAMDVFVLLARDAGQVVLHENPFAQLWPIPADDRFNQGISSVLPVVRRASRSRCAFAASASE